MDKRTADVLYWVNVQRARIGLPEIYQIKSGVPGAATNCPIARSMVANDDKGWSANIFKVLYIFDNDHKPILSGMTVPLHVHNWILDFDTGKYPQYDSENNDASN